MKLRPLFHDTTGIHAERAHKTDEIDRARTVVRLFGRQQQGQTHLSPGNNALPKPSDHHEENAQIRKRRVDVGTA